MAFDALPLIGTAQWIGRHALPLYLAALAVLLGGVATAWSALQRPRHAQPRRTAFMLAATVLAAIAVAAAATAAAPAGWLPSRLDLGHADQVLSQAVGASIGPVALWAFATITHLADTAAMTAWAVAGSLVLALRGRRDLALGWVAAIGGNALLNRSLKHLFARARPLHDDALAVAADGFSFPSGHTSGAVVLFGMLAVIGVRLLPTRWHLPLLLAAVALAFSVGASRVMLRVHFASDVLAGFVSGSAWLAVCIAGLAFVRRRGSDLQRR